MYLLYTYVFATAGKTTSSVTEAFVYAAALHVPLSFTGQTNCTKY